jgi:hypothetical protein
MDEFGSPIAGGIRAVRRNISSSFLGASQRQQQPQPDTVTTNLLQQQSLQITTVSRQLESITSQITSLNTALSGVKDNLAISDQIERQREIAKQKREAILAEQGLREGKESALEAKIQNALFTPVQKIGQKTQGVLSRLFESFLFLAGGWLTVTSIDFIQALVEKNGEKIRRVGTVLAGGLVLIGGTITAVTIGLKSTLANLGRFVTSVGRVAFGGLIKGALGGVRRLLSAISKASIAKDILNLIPGGGGKRGPLRTVRNVLKTGVTSIASTLGLDSVFRRSKSLLGRGLKFFTDSSKGTAIPIAEGANKNLTRLKPQTKFQNLLSRFNPFKGVGKEVVEEGSKKALKEASKKVVKKGIFGGLIKKVLGPLRGKGGFLGALLIDVLVFGESIDNALAGAAGFVAGAKVGAAAGAAIGAFFGGIGAGPGALIGGFIGGMVGETAMKSLYKGIKNMIGLGGKEETVEVSKTLNDNDFEAINDNVSPLLKNNDEIALNISDTENLEGTPTVINIPLEGGSSQTSGGTSPVSNSGVSETLPNISFDNDNPHTLFTTVTTGVSA